MLLPVPAVLLAAQMVEHVTVPDPAMSSFDLARVRPNSADRNCVTSAETGDIVVCGRKKAMDIDISRLPAYAEKPIRATAALPGGATTGVSVQQGNVGGVTTNRVMVGIKLPF